MRSNLRKAFIVGLAAFVVVAVASVLVEFVSADSGCSFDETICFEMEQNPKHIGSYQIMDSNGSIIETNYWKNGLDLFFNPECVYLPWGTKTTFYSDWSKDWIWEIKTDLFGKECYRLKRY